MKKLRKEGEKLRGYEQQEKQLQGRNSYSKTDPDATFMRMKNGQLRGAYNLQIGTENGFILGYSLSQTPNDAASLSAHLEARKRQRWSKSPENLIADAGYGTEENYDLLQEKKIEAYVKYPSWYREMTGKLRPFEKAAFEYDEKSDEFICPAGWGGIAHEFIHATLPLTREGSIVRSIADPQLGTVGQAMPPS